MTKTLTLVDFKKKRINFEIENFENVCGILIQVITGDETAIISYNDGTFMMFDTSDMRINSYYDGAYPVPKEEIDAFSSTEGGSYDRMDRWM